MPEVKIGSGSGTVILAANEREQRLGELRCDLRAGALSVSRQVHAFDFADLAEFFERLASEWRGWSGTRAWSSLEGDLGITAEHHRKVRLRVELRGDSFGTDWHAAATVELDPGEELAAVAADVRALVGGTPPTA